jgi:hypothetical protein
VSDGGLELALAEASSWSGRDFRVETEAARGSIVLACPPRHVERLGWPALRVLGAVA